MRKNRNEIIVGCLALTQFLAFGTSCQRKNAEQENVKSPNVIVILADDQGWGATSILMNKSISESKSDFIHTPNLERLAEKGVIFSNGYASHPNCSPTRASLLTGKSPAKLHLTDIVERHTGPLYEGNKLIPPTHIDGLPSKEITIAEIIKTNRPEYSTAHFGKWHLANGGPAMHGFDESDGETSNNEGNLRLDGNPKDIFGITSRAISWMDQQVNNETPFYLQLSHYATHLGMESKDETIAKIGSRTPGERHTNIKYAGMAEDLDEGVGLLLDEVDRLGISENTYIIYVADNGTYPTNNPGNINGPLHGWKATAWEGGIRVPFMIAGPGIEHAYSDLRVVTYDLFPTICEWLNIQKLPDGLEGGSLSEIVDSSQHEQAVSRANDFLVFHFPHYQLQKGSQPVSTIIKGDYKLYKLYEDNRFMLFNLKDDVDETLDLVSEKPEVVGELKALLEGYLESINAGLPTVNEDYNEATDPGLKYVDVKERMLAEPYFVIGH
ncbi:sulfatase [Sunxiuqinia sp. A32]|uniref:sulfatase n=1 Tax=Sunxiuqinia sp. A32 TaxID=3461496 RepID=UPI0040461C17